MVKIKVKDFKKWISSLLLRESSAEPERSCNRHSALNNPCQGNIMYIDDREQHVE